MTIAFCLLLAWGVMLAVPATPLARALHRALVDWPARTLPLLGRGHVALALLLVSAALVLLWVMEADGLRLMAMAAPEIATWATMFEVSTLLDAAIAVAVAASSLRLRVVTHAIAATARRFRPRARRTRAHRAAQRPPANDDDRPALATAA